jgi:predicted nucleic-acid-binding protein
VTVLEVAWVLKSLYKRSREEIANDIEMVLSADTLEVQNEQAVYHVVVALRNGTGTFEDGLIGSLGIWSGYSSTLTFDEMLHRDCTVSHRPDRPFAPKNLSTTPLSLVEQSASVDARSRSSS